jgi:hypothetical protein
MSPSPIREDAGARDQRRSFRFMGVPICALVCALTLLAAILVAHPYAEVGISDDFSYVRSAQLLAESGHVVYNGGATAILGWQLYLAAAFIKLFGFSFTTTRASMIFLSAVTTFLCQRTFVRAGINEWNASIGTLTLMLSPLLMPLEVTFMSDVPGMFAIILCLYLCLRTLEADGDRATITWIGIASLSNVVFGSSRQIAWLGVLVMIPSVLWIMRRNRRVAMAGISFWLVSVGLIFSINRWFHQQPYILYEPLTRGSVNPVVLRNFGREWVRACLEIVLLLLPILLMYLPALRRRKHRWVVYLLGCGFLLYGVRMWRVGNLSAWYAPYLGGVQPFALLRGFRPILTVAVLVCLLALVSAIFAGVERPPSARGDIYPLSREVAELIVPCTIAYIVLLSPRVGFETIWDRYLLPLLFVALVFLLRFYQDQFQARLPVAALVLAIGAGVYATASLHDRLALYRARVTAINEVLAAGVPATSVSGGWDYDGWTELQVSTHIFDQRMRVPAGVQLEKPTHYGLKDCPWFYCDMFPHMIPYYTISLRPDPVLGNKFAPVPYRTWVDSSGAVYVVRFPDRSVDGLVP